ncbi:Uncharacterized protein APZ42_033111 [Daphnia magna]|uniref:Uncharacterized protein n=1 Tax=Daphnia magna TaxID=35525 RepID=A0A164LDD2_9CRUS|nr:Uncharacterized protein APZ42_033111 [Daphnia magna]
MAQKIPRKRVYTKPRRGGFPLATPVHPIELTIINDTPVATNTYPAR